MGTLTIRLNGEPYEIAGPVTISALPAQLQIDPAASPLSTTSWSIKRRSSGTASIAVKIRLQKKVHRTRRLDADAKEEDRLLAAAEPHMRDLIVAALESTCRQGELLSLQRRQVAS
jgi:sulfur carrier protein ThiS